MVCAKTQQLDRVRGLVNPYQQEVILYVAFHASLIDAVQLVRLVLGRNPPCLLKMNQKVIELTQFCRLVGIPLEVLLEFGRPYYCLFHYSMDLINASKLERSTSSSSTPLRHSSMAASVSALG